MESIITPPKHVKEIMRTLEKRSHNAYLIGSCVRDMLLGLRPNHWDISTSASSEEVTKLFEKIEISETNDYLVTVSMSKNKKVQILTWGQKDGLRNDSSSTYIANLTNQLTNQVFTIDAIAIPLNGVLLDPLGGLADIKNRLIRSVGNAEKLFSENPAEMLSVFRFASRLGLQIEEKTMEGIVKSAHLTATFSHSQIRKEIDKILRSANPIVMYDLIQCGLLDRFLNNHEISREYLSSLSLICSDMIMRWTGLCAILLKHKLIDSVSDFLEDMELDGINGSCITMGIQLANDGLPDDKYYWKLLLSKYGRHSVRCAAAAADAVEGNSAMQQKLQSVIKSGDCFSINRLSITPEDLIALGYESEAEIGVTMDELLAHVIKYPDDNKKNVLITKAVYMISRKVNAG